MIAGDVNKWTRAAISRLRNGRRDLRAGDLSICFPIRFFLGFCSDEFLLVKPALFHLFNY